MCEVEQYAELVFSAQYKNNRESVKKNAFFSKSVVVEIWICSEAKATR